MIRRFYALPEVEKGANAVELLSLDLVTGTIRAQPGTLTGDSFTADGDLRMNEQTVADPAGFVAWYGADPSQRNAEDNEVQQLATGLLYYLWLQRKGLLGG